MDPQNPPSVPQEVPKGAKVTVFSEGSSERFKLRFKNMVGFADNVHVGKLKLKTSQLKGALAVDVLTAMFGNANEVDAEEDMKSRELRKEERKREREQREKRASSDKITEAIEKEAGLRRAGERINNLE